jgi:hypothetical protein
MQYSAVRFGPVALAALDSLDPPLRDRLFSEIRDLARDPESRPNVFDSDWQGAEYVLRPDADPGLDVLFRCNQETKVIEVVDVIRPEALRSVFRQAVSSGPSK